jgi:hypothetical protein
VSTVKLRQAGFGVCYDTQDTLRWWIAEMQRRRLNPPQSTPNLHAESGRDWSRTFAPSPSASG